MRTKEKLGWLLIAIGVLPVALFAVLFFGGGFWLFVVLPWFDEYGWWTFLPFAFLALLHIGLKLIYTQSLPTKQSQ